MANTATLNVTIVYSTDPAQAVADRALYRYDQTATGIEVLRRELERLASGITVGKVLAFLDQGDGTAGIGRVACTQASVSTGDTVTVSGVVFTVAASPSTKGEDGQFAAGASDTDCAANLAAAINAHPALAGLVTAAGSAGNCNITLVDKGLHGTFLFLAKSGSGFTLTQVSALTPGAKGTAQSHLRCFRRGA